jgi:HSP20 family protein
VTTLVRWNPLRDVAAMHNDLSRLMNGLLDVEGRQSQAWVPTLDVWETDDALVYAFDLPGVKQDEISVEVEDGALTVSATRERETKVDRERFHSLERRYGSFARTVGLPQGVSEDDIEASYTNGVLEIRVPKPAQAKPKRIAVRGEGDSALPTIEG